MTWRFICRGLTLLWQPLSSRRAWFNLVSSVKEKEGKKKGGKDVGLGSHSGSHESLRRECTLGKHHLSSVFNVISMAWAGGHQKGPCKQAPPLISLYSKNILCHQMGLNGLHTLMLILFFFPQILPSFQNPACPSSKPSNKLSSIYFSPKKHLTQRGSRREGIYVYIADSLCCTAESNTTW